MANRSNFAEPGTGVGNRTKNFKLEAGSNRFRIGPAYASCAASGRWNVSIQQHYGYRSAEDEQGKSFPRTFVCPRVVNRKTEIIEKPCAECDDTEVLSEKLELRQQKLVDDGKSEEEIDTILGPQKKYLKEHNLDKKHLVLAKNESNEWGVLWLPWKALEALLARRKKVLEEDGFDILSTKDGCWVDFIRAGEGFRNTTYACDIVTEVVVTESGKKAKVAKQEALADADFDAIEATCPDLTTVGTHLTNEQIERLVESRGDTDIVDAVFNEARDIKKGHKEASASPARTQDTKRQAKPEPEAAPGPKRQVRPEPEDIPEEETITKAPVEPAEDDEEAVLMAQLAAARAKKAAAARAATQAVEETKKATFKPLPADVEVVGDPDSLPDDQFLSVYGKGNKAN
jgi:hypothetical protein